AAIRFAFACIFGELVFFAFLSILYDFHNCPNPSREHPYFHAGRMMLGALVPFLLLFVYGIDRLLSRLGSRGKFFALSTIIFSMLVLEIVADLPAFFSRYNWFHM